MSALLYVRRTYGVFMPIITSPQTLAKLHWVGFCIDKPILNNTLFGIVLDKVQLFIDFGFHFYPKFPALKHIIFDKINTGTRTINYHEFVMFNFSVIIVYALLLVCTYALLYICPTFGP